MTKVFYAEGSGTLLDHIEQPQSAQILGYRFENFDYEAMTIDVAFEASSTLLNAAGTVQGGFIAAMLDEVTGGLVVLCTDGCYRAATLSLNISYLSAARTGVLKGRGRITKLGKATVFLSAELRRDDDTIVAKSDQVAALFSLGEAKGRG
ncbi:MAG: PaaI family thioesterase [Pseudomonadota bacterium]